MKTAPIIAVCLAATLAAIALVSSNGIASSGPVSLSDLAPADEYFGREHLSAIVIRHKVFALKDDLHHARMMPGSVQHDADEVQDALADWTQKFPRDPWIPGTAWYLATLYEELPGPDAQKQAVSMLQIVRDKYGESQFGGYAARDLARGVGVRPWPHWAATPAPPSVTTLVQSILALRSMRDPARAQTSAIDLESRYWALSRDGNDPAYARAAWELAAAYERLPGDQARGRAIRLLALLLDRYPSQIFGAWALRDLERGVGQR